MGLPIAAVAATIDFSCLSLHPHFPFHVVPIPAIASTDHPLLHRHPGERRAPSLRVGNDHRPDWGPADASRTCPRCTVIPANAGTHPSASETTTVLTAELPTLHARAPVTRSPACAGMTRGRWHWSAGAARCSAVMSTDIRSRLTCTTPYAFHLVEITRRIRAGVAPLHPLFRRGVGGNVAGNPSRESQRTTRSRAGKLRPRPLRRRPVPHPPPSPGP